MSAWRTQERTDSTPYPSWRATRCTVPCSVPNSARNARTIRTAAAFSSGLYLRAVGFPGGSFFGMTPSSFPRSGASSISRAIQVAELRQAEYYKALLGEQRAHVEDEIRNCCVALAQTRGQRKILRLRRQLLEKRREQF